MIVDRPRKVRKSQVSASISRHQQSSTNKLRRRSSVLDSIASAKASSQRDAIFCSSTSSGTVAFRLGSVGRGGIDILVGSTVILQYSIVDRLGLELNSIFASSASLYVTSSDVAVNPDPRGHGRCLETGSCLSIDDINSCDLVMLSHDLLLIFSCANDGSCKESGSR